MILYFAAVGSDLWQSHIIAAEERTRNVMFSYYDIDLGEFQFRRRGWEKVTGRPFQRVCHEYLKEQSRAYRNDGGGLSEENKDTS